MIDASHCLIMGRWHNWPDLRSLKLKIWNEGYVGRYWWSHDILKASCWYLKNCGYCSITSFLEGGVTWPDLVACPEMIWVLGTKFSVNVQKWCLVWNEETQVNEQKQKRCWGHHYFLLLFSENKSGVLNNPIRVRIKAHGQSGHFAPT